MGLCERMRSRLVVNLFSLTLFYSSCLGYTDIYITPYPAFIYSRAPKDVPVLTIEAIDNATGARVTDLRLVRGSDAIFFRLGTDGILYTNQSIDFKAGDRSFEFFVFAIKDNAADYKHIKIDVSEKNTYAPRFLNTPYAFEVYRYGVGDLIGEVKATDDDQVDYNRRFTISIPTHQQASDYVSLINKDATGSERTAQILLSQPVPETISTLNLLVTAVDEGSPQQTATTMVKIDIMMVKQPDKFCISTSRTTTTLCWKNPMPGVTFEGYMVEVVGSLERTGYVPFIDGHTESCFLINGTKIGDHFVFSVSVKSSTSVHDTNIQLAFNKTATGYTRNCDFFNFSVCNYNNPCNGQGTCSQKTPGLPLSYTCLCNEGWKGENCTIPDSCAYLPCQNGGSCISLDNASYNCTCPSSYYGKDCQYYDKCLDTPCANSGTCNRYNGSYSCNCSDGFSGNHCEVRDPCAPSPCVSGRGECKRQSDTEFLCDCFEDYYGDLCQYKDACRINPCLYYGTCVPVNDSFHCLCQPETTGQRCETADPCQLNPCKNSGICNADSKGSYKCNCTPDYSGNECQYFNACYGVDCRNGSCRQLSTSYTCDCINGYFGKPCVNYDVCLNLPCGVGGVCKSFDVNNNSIAEYKPYYQCECSDDWYGPNCQYVNLCNSGPCQNGGTCNNIPPNSFKCDCQPGYNLTDCSGYNPCYSQPCKNGGECLIEFTESYRCVCQEGYLPPDCSEFDQCFQHDCKNGGTCVPDSAYGYHCDCPPGYLPPDCSARNTCYVNECQNGGLCRNLSQTTYKCDCNQDWTGARCELRAACQADQGGCICVNQRLQCPQTGSVSQKLNNLLDQTSDPSKLTVKEVVFYTDELLDLYNETLFKKEYASIAFNVVGNLGRANVSVSNEAELLNSTNTRLREFLDNYTSEVNITANGEITIPTNDFEVKAVLLNRTDDQQNFTFVLETNFNSSQLDLMHNLSITLPWLVVGDSNSSTNDTRLQFIGYKRSQLFVPAEGFGQYGALASLILNRQRVVSATVSGRQLTNLSEPVVIRLPKIQEGVNHTCVFWDTNASNWSTAGVIQFEDEFGYVTCHSDHLTSFAVLMEPVKSKLITQAVNADKSILFMRRSPANNKDDASPSQRLSKEHEDALTYITYIGCGISLACLVITVLTYGLFKCLSNDKSGKILIQLGTSLIFLNIIFLVGSVDVSQYSNVGCVIVALLLHYFILAAFMWMLVEAIEMYQALVTVFSKYERFYLIKRCLVAWGVPVLIVGITAAIDIDSYHNDTDPREICFLTSRNAAAYYSSLIAPCCLIIIINTVVFIMVARVILKPKFQQQLNNDTVTITPAQIRGAFTVMFLLGITWVFGPLAINEAKLVFSYIFCICNSLQGFLIFVFRCLLNPEAKLAWVQLFQTGTLKRRRGPIKSVYTDSSSKAEGNQRRMSNSNGSGFLSTGSTKVNLTKSGNGFHPHPHQLHTTNGWHPNLNGTKSDKFQTSTQGLNYKLSPKSERRHSREYSITTKRESLPNDSMSEFQDELTHF